MHADQCFDVFTYQRMAAGQLPAAEMEKVYAHLESCARCLQVVKSLPEPTLVAFMRNRIRPTNPVSMMFSCPGCREKLKVKKESAGQKVKCPKCGQMMQIPLPVAKVLASTPAARAVAAEANTVPPKGVPSPGVTEAPTLPPVNARTVAPVAKDDTSLGNRPDATLGADFRDEGSLTDFLAPPLEPDEIGRLGIYRVLKVLGAGGMGVVFKAEDPGLKRLVAIKAMLPAIAASASAKTRFLREAQAAAGIKHSHIVTIHQVSEDRGVPFLAMEFLEGESLDDRLKREPTLPPAEVLRIGREMAEGIAAAHERGLIHRDIKPANTWLETSPGHMASPGRKSGEYHVKILDFGLARPTDDQAHLTQSGAIIGTPAYMAPEQARGEKLDARCDLWSLGVVLYRMCTGDVPFKGADTVSTLMAVAMNNPPPPAKVNGQVPVGLSNLVMKLLEKDPAKRLGSAHELVGWLRELEQGRPATPATAALSSGKSSQSRLTTLASAVGTFAGNAITHGGAAGLPALRAMLRHPRRSLLTACALILLLLLGYWVFQIVIVRDREGNEIARVKVPKDGSLQVVPEAMPEQKKEPEPNDNGNPRAGAARAQATYIYDQSFRGNQSNLWEFPATKITLDQKQKEALAELRKQYEPEIKAALDQLRSAIGGKGRHDNSYYFELRFNNLVTFVSRKRRAILTEEQGAVLGISPTLIPAYATQQALNDPRIWDFAETERIFTIQSRSFDYINQTIALTVITKKKWTDSEKATDIENWGSPSSPPSNGGSKIQVRFYDKEQVLMFSATSQSRIVNVFAPEIWRNSLGLTEKQAEQGLQRWRIVINLDTIGGSAYQDGIAAVRLVYPMP